MTHKICVQSWLDSNRESAARKPICLYYDLHRYNYDYMNTPFYDRKLFQTHV